MAEGCHRWMFTFEGPSGGARCAPSTNLVIGRGVATKSDREWGATGSPPTLAGEGGAAPLPSSGGREGGERRRRPTGEERAWERRGVESRPIRGQTGPIFSSSSPNFQLETRSEAEKAQSN